MFALAGLGLDATARAVNAAAMRNRFNLFISRLLSGSILKPV
jgi:hypothetical protein